MANLPVKSQSRGIQRSHVRRVQTVRGVKPVLVNKDVKPKPVKEVRSPVVQEQKEVKALTVDEHRKSLQPKLRWEAVLKPDTGIVPAKELSFDEEVRKSLQKGEVIANNIKLLYPTYFGVGGYIEFVDQDGKAQRWMFEYRMSNSGLIEWLQEKERAGEPVIFGPPDWGSNNFVGYVREYSPVDKEPEEEEIPFYDRVPANQKRLSEYGKSSGKKRK